MSTPRLTPERACIAFTLTSAEVRRLTAIIRPTECTELATSEWVHGNMTTPIEPCISKLFSLKREGPTGADEEAFNESVEEIESEMCERCIESLKAVRDRKVARRKLSSAKRAVDIVGKRLLKEQA